MSGGRFDPGAEEVCGKKWNSAVRRRARVRGRDASTAVELRIREAQSSLSMTGFLRCESKLRRIEFSAAG